MTLSDAKLEALKADMPKIRKKLQDLKEEERCFNSWLKDTRGMEDDEEQRLVDLLEITERKIAELERLVESFEQHQAQVEDLVAKSTALFASPEE